MKFRRKIEISLKTNNSSGKSRLILHTRDIDLHFYLGGVAWGAFFEAVEFADRSAHEQHIKRKLFIGHKKN